MTRVAMGYLGYWALFDKPFARTDGDYFFSAAPQREAIAGLSYFTASHFGAAFLVASRRCGVSWLMRHVCQMSGMGDCATEVVITEGLQHDCSEVAASLGQALGIRTESGHSITLETIDTAIETCHHDGVKVVWLIDRVSPCTINTARGLVASHSNLSVVLAATPNEHHRFAPSFGERVVQVDLDPLSLDETADYLRGGLANVGCQQPIFQDGAAVRLHEFTSGAIADLAMAAEVSLAVAARYQMDVVTSAIVEAALEPYAQAA